MTHCATSAGCINEKKFRGLVEQYLASVPELEDPKPIALADVTAVPFQFPQKPTRAEVPLRMKESVTQVQVTFPAEVCNQLAGPWSSACIC